jgi:hypothetical protein
MIQLPSLRPVAKAVAASFPPPHPRFPIESMSWRQSSGVESHTSSAPIVLENSSAPKLLKKPVD